MNKTRKPDPRVKAPDLVQVQEGFSPSKKTTPQWPLSDKTLSELVCKRRRVELKARIEQLRNKYPTFAQSSFKSLDQQAQEVIETAEVVLNFKDLMMILVGAMTPFINQLNTLTKEVEELKEIVVRYADEVRKSKKKR